MVVLVLLNGSAGLSSVEELGTRWTVDLESLCFSLYKCTRFDIIAVLYTCTTVASRVAANACALTHARRSLWHRRLTHHTHTITHLNVPNLGILNPWSI